MFKPKLLFLFFTFLFACLMAPSFIFAAETTNFQGDLLKNIKWREIGPTAFGGRIDDIEAVVDNPSIIFVAAASGGIFKSTDNGITWKPVFDEEGTALSIGDIAIAASDPNIIWAGTGEPNSRQSSSWGDGIYKSVDGGETWKFMGLRETHHIGRVVIHPRNPDIVYVAALGHLWGSNPERGLYRTKDGGKTWEKILGIDDNTGVVDVALEDNGRVMYAAAYQKQRRAWGFVGGGPTSGLYRSLDGGDTWEKLSRGLPSGDTGRIGVEISKSRPNIIYAIVENKNGGVFRSEDRGETWKWMNELNPRPMYYSEIRIDPQNPNKIWVLGGELHVSIDGGKTFTKEGTGDKIHSDHHALWINPKNPEHLLLGNDGGFYISYNGSKTWDFIDNLPIAQFYGIGIDNREPYWVYGGAQDHGNYGLPSRTFSSLGITNSDVINVIYGDAFHVIVDPENPAMIFAENQEGRLLLVNMVTREEKYIRPVPEDPKEVYRFNWTCPLVFSPHGQKIVYYAGNKLFKTTDQGTTWEVISPDLTRNQEWRKIPIMGLVRNEDTLSRNDGVAHYGTITAISESPVQVGLIYAGTDDGNVQLTMDGGKTWQNLTEKFRPQSPRWVSSVLASSHNPGTAYVSFDGHYDDDFRPYIFKTIDFGKTWKLISDTIPYGMAVNVVEEHPRNADLLFAGTEFGLFISADGGKSWSLAGGNLPRVPVDDIIVNARDNDLILGTHGRGIIILDDIAMLEHLNQDVIKQEVHLFPPRTATQYFEMRELPNPGAAKFSGPNPDYGALMTYYLKTDPQDEKQKPQAAAKVKLLILDPEAKVVAEFEGPDRRGFNRISWDLRYPLGLDATETSAGYFEPKKGPFVLPGEYTVKLVARNKELIQKVTVRIDPRIKAEPEGLRARFEASMTVREMQRAFIEGQKAAKEIEKELKRIKDVTKDEVLPEEMKTKIDEASKKMSEIKESFKVDWYGLEFTIMDLEGQLQATTSAPTQAQLRTLNMAMEKIDLATEKINSLLVQELPALESQLLSKGIRTLFSKPIKSPKKN